MIREDVLNGLEKRNGYCECPELQELYSKRKAAQGLNEKCQFYRSLIGDLKNVSPDQIDNLKLYREAVKQFRTAKTNYSVSLASAHQRRAVKAIVRDDAGEGELEVSLINIPKIQKKKIVTLHCAKCEQQIDLLHLG